MKFNTYKKEQEQPNQEDFTEYEDIEDSLENEEGYYDEETDIYYSREDIEREQRYLDRVEARNNFRNKVKNPFGLGDKINNIDEKIQYGSSKTKLFFILGTLLALTIFVIILTMFI